MIANLVQSISVIPNNITRSVYTHDCANLLSIDEKMLIREVNKIRLKNVEKQKNVLLKRKKLSLLNTMKRFAMFFQQILMKSMSDSLSTILSVMA